MFLFSLSGRDRHKPLYRDGRCDSDIQRAARLQRRGGGRGLQRKTQDSKYILLNDLPLIRSPSQQGYIGEVEGEDFNERQAYIVFYNHPFFPTSFTKERTSGRVAGQKEYRLFFNNLLIPKRDKTPANQCYNCIRKLAMLSLSVRCEPLNSNQP